MAAPEFYNEFSAPIAADAARVFPWFASVMCLPTTARPGVVTAWSSMNLFTAG
jgi:hypothetical protein